MSRSKTVDMAEGSSLNEIIGEEDNSQVFEIKPSPKHIVLYHLPFHKIPGEPPHPQRGHHNSDRWDHDHVRLPCSSKNVFGDQTKWEKINESLWQPLRNSKNLEEAIKSYNPKYRHLNFSAMHELFKNAEENDEFFDNILPAIITIALRLPTLIPGSIPLLKRGRRMSISMTQEQAACLLANAFLCTFPMRNEESEVNLPTINFSRLFSMKEKPIIEKLKCIINYFNRVLCGKDKPVNVITFQRHYINEELYNWMENDQTFSDIKYRVTSEGTIQDGHGMLQVDFANCLIGGGVLGHGCVQEEIRFVINPEMIVARLFTEKLDHNEALTMIGCEQFNKYRGYASSFEFAGDFKDKTQVDPFHRRMCRVVAIDALPYENQKDQFTEANLQRELNKATAGFSVVSSNESLPVATGLWGCGAFKGHIIKSALIQLIAAKRTGRNIVLYTFGDEKAKEDIGKIFDYLVKKEVTIGKLYKMLLDFKNRKPFNPNLLIPFIMEENLAKKTKKKIIVETLKGIFDYNVSPPSRSHSQNRVSESKGKRKADRKHSQ